MIGKEILVEKIGVDRSLLKQNNVSNFLDVSEKTLFRHEKEVESNCRKALACCLADESHYLDYNCTFKSRTNRDNYLNWLRKVMQSSVPPCIVDADLNNGGSSGDDNTTQKENPNSLSDEFFRGYFAFELWGYIPLDGGDKYKSSLIGTIVDTDVKVKKENSRSEIRGMKLNDKQYVKDLDRRGDSRLNKEANDNLGELGSILIKGRKEMEKQRLFKCRIYKIEFEMRYQTSKIKEIQDEIK